jgi:predicted alpha/beta superfamily hydrolase
MNERGTRVKARCMAAAGQTIALVAFLLCSPAPTFSQGTTVEPIVIGHIDELQSTILGEARRLEIHLPSGYVSGTDAYPVLIVLDGGDFFRYMASIPDAIAPNYVPPMIVVGLPNTERNRDLDPTDASLGEAGIGVTRFQRFLAEELLPFLDGKYRTVSYRILAGHSLAGAFTLHTLFRRPELFNAYIATSPSLRSESMRIPMQRAMQETRSLATQNRFAFLSAGDREGADFISPLREMVESMTVWGSGNLTVGLEVYDNEGHVPLSGFHEGLRTLFHDWFPYDAFLSADWPALSRHYSRLSERYGYTVTIPSSIGSSAANRILQAGDTAMAVRAYRDLTAVYPQHEGILQRLRDLTGR